VLIVVAVTIVALALQLRDPAPKTAPRGELVQE
jgi:hypothetical protein